MGFFIDGLAYDYLKIKVMRDNPATLADAVNIAMNEQNLRRRFDLRKGHTNDILRHEAPMEVDHYRPDKRCFNCHKKGHLANKCKVKKINSVQKDRQTDRQCRQPQQSDRLYRQPDKRHIICWKCGKRGHYKRECWETRQSNEADSKPINQEN